MLTRDQRAYLNFYLSHLDTSDGDTCAFLMGKMDTLYGRFTWKEMDVVEEWIDLYHRGKDTEDISGVGYDAQEI